MYCKNCGQKVPDGVRFCTVCGSPIDEVAFRKFLPICDCGSPVEIYSSSGMSRRYKAACIKTLILTIMGAFLLLGISCIATEKGTLIENGESIITTLRVLAGGLLIAGFIAAGEMRSRGECCRVRVVDRAGSGVYLVPLVSPFVPKPCKNEIHFHESEIVSMGEASKSGDFKIVLKNGRRIRVLAQEPDECMAAIGKLLHRTAGANRVR